MSKVNSAVSKLLNPPSSRHLRIQPFQHRYGMRAFLEERALRAVVGKLGLESINVPGASGNDGRTHGVRSPLKPSDRSCLAGSSRPPQAPHLATTLTHTSMGFNTSSSASIIPPPGQRLHVRPL